LGSPAIFALGATNQNNNGFGTAINPLPVELTNFAAARQGSGVVIGWATAREQNSAHFEVQRSLTGGEFSTVAKVTAQGNSSRPTSYTAIDEKAPASVVYYRLRQVDLDGKTAFSPVVSVASGKSELLIYPSPAQRVVNFMVAAATPYRVLNQVGQVLLQGTAEAGAATIEVSKLSPGVYHLEFQTSAGRVVRKFVKE
jgi:hypothetical protein